MLSQTWGSRKAGSVPFDITEPVATGDVQTQAGESRALLHRRPSSSSPTTLALHGSLDAVSWARGHPSHPDTPPNIYEGGLGAQQQCPGAQGSKPKNFRLRHLRGLGLYLPSHMQPAGQGESHWLGQLMARGCLPPPKGMAWPLDLPHGTLGPGDSHRSVLLETQVPGDSLENPGLSLWRTAPPFLF
ncbi:uncharacterized protein C16orf90 homolog isoform X2 [Neofelis nebulosa]|uniref:uncharacterized protein C16orf90 homolog isoform X2 n=1 Tax=Neofelis nebulosa TaxID=61452 RepID=UPI00272A6C9F|nr:uncharacterized protein C16orf90 homolog isoform X2 [Neofelis nebulosa]